MRLYLFFCIVCASLMFWAPASQAFERGQFREKIKERIAEKRATSQPDSMPPNEGGIRDRIKQTHEAGGLRERSGGAETITLAGRTVYVWQPATRAMRAPLIVFSHGFGGCGTQSKFLTQALAQSGYLVMAPNHKDASCGGGSGRGSPEENFKNPENWTESTYQDRRDDIAAVLKALETDPDWSARVYWSRVGLAGHSFGGYTALGLGGAWPSWKLGNIKAVLALSPYCAPFLENGDLGNISAPVMYQGGTRDFGITPSVKKPGGCYDSSSSPAYFVEFEKAGHFAWTDLNKNYHSAINHYAVGFFDKYLKGGALTDIQQKLPGVSDLRSK